MNHDVARTVWFSALALQAIRAEATERYPEETGGLLMGYMAPSKGAIVVTGTVGPGPGAIHSALAFTPDHDFHEREVARLHAYSEGELLYLGDWHSHPRGGLVLSEKDRATLRRIASSAEALAPTPLMAVLAGTPEVLTGGWRLGLYLARLRHRLMGWKLLEVTTPQVIEFVPGSNDLQ